MGAFTTNAPCRSSSRAKFVSSSRVLRTMAVDGLVSGGGSLDPATIDEARTAFFFWLFGASGGAGIARSAFPRMYNNVREVNALQGVGPTKLGEPLELSPLCGYPRPIYKADVEQIVNKKQTVEDIVRKFPVEGNFLSARGYLTFQAFQMANKDANPLALRVVFDSLNTSSDICSPDIAQEKLEDYKANINSLASSALSSRFKGYAAIFGLLFLLALADYEAFVVHFRTGTFATLSVSALKPRFFHSFHVK